jgi:hypothetical protein
MMKSIPYMVNLNRVTVKCKLKVIDHKVVQEGLLVQPQSP